MSRAAGDPVAIIGIGCRFPGNADSPEAFWSLLVRGVDAIEEVPKDRWTLSAYYSRDPARRGHMATRWGGFLRDIEAFDAAYFGITPREAVLMDPQQRLLLETTWEALEDAGIRPESLAGSNTGVYIGVSVHDYAIIQSTAVNRYRIGAHTMAGVSNCIVANRVSYLLDVRGPSMSIDTACSSSLVALHVACRALRYGEVGAAIVGGVNLLLNPLTTVGFSQGGFLSPDGRCKAFDHRANGYVRSEGAATVVLKPLSQALKDGDGIYAVIRGTAINQDGRTKGISLPSREAQEALVLRACEDAGIQPGRVEYVEAHGTGTPAGDPIEAAALSSALSVGRAPGTRCAVGTVKSNIGHLEGCAGMAGLIKASLVLQRAQIPPSLHFESPNRDIPLERMAIRVVTALEPWSNGNGPRLAGVNSFGFGGANAHVILEEAPAGGVVVRGERSSEKQGPLLFPLSGRTEKALRAQADRVVRYLESGTSTGSLQDVCHASATTKSQYEYRFAALVDSTEGLCDTLRTFATDGVRANGRSGQKHAVLSGAKLAFVCSGQGAQWWGMGRELLRTEPVFEHWVRRCDEALRTHVDWSLWRELQADEDSSRIDETEIAQPAILALQVALAELWRSWGIQPDGIVGHSVGEVAAAYISGALSFEEAIRVIFHRSRLQQRTSGRGKMLAVGLSAEAVREWVAPLAGRVSVAAFNGPQLLTLAGDPDALEGLAEKLSAEQVFCRMLRVNVAFHSHHMDPIEQELRASLAGMASRDTRVPMYSTVTASPVLPGALDAEYWWRNTRRPVMFASTVLRMIEDGYRVFVELGAHPIHGTAISELLSEAGQEGRALASLVRQKSDQDVFLGSAAELYCLGKDLNWKAQLHEAKRVKLPTYPWQREVYWNESEAGRRIRLGAEGHPLVGEYRATPEDPRRHSWELDLDPARLPWLADHRVQGLVVFPAAGYLDMLLGCLEAAFGEGVYAIEDVEFRKALFVPDDARPPRVQVVIGPDDSLRVFAKQERDEGWSLHVTGRFSRPEQPEEAGPELATFRERCTAPVETKTLYDTLDHFGLNLGPTFKAIEALWRTDGASVAQVGTPAGVADEAPAHQIHPAILDSCFQALSVAMHRALLSGGPDVPVDGLYLPVGIRRLTFHRRPRGRLWTFGDGGVLENRLFAEGAFSILAEDGSVVTRFEGFRVKSITSTDVESRRAMQWLYDFAWQPRAHRDPTERADFMPAPAALRDEATPLIAALRDAPESRRYHASIEPQLNEVCIGYLVGAFRAMGFAWKLGEEFTVEGLATQLRVAPPRTQYLRRILAILRDQGLLAEDGDRWTVARVPDRSDPAQALRALWQRQPELEWECRLLERCGARQADVLLGRVNPIEVIFSEREFQSVGNLYEISFSNARTNKVVCQVVRSVVDRLPPGRTLRVLEIGSGTGGTTANVLPELPPDRVEYLFSDVSQLFLTKARERFAPYEFVEYRTLDVEQPPAEQGFVEHTYDLIIATNVLHATRNLSETFGNVRKLLASQGTLVVVEVTQPPLWLDLTFGMTDGWWRFEDRDLRGDYPLLTDAAWAALLPRVGFTEHTILTDRASAAESGNLVLVGRGPALEAADLKPESRRGAWIVLSDGSRLGEAFVRELGEHAAGSLVVAAGETFAKQGDLRFTARPNRAEDLQRVFEHAAKAGPVAGVLHLWSVDSGMGETAASLAELRAAEVAGCYSAIASLQALERTNWPGERPHLWMVTRGTQPVGGTPPRNVEAAAIWGVLRCMLTEIPDLRAKAIDLDQDPLDLEAANLAHEFLYQEGADEEVAFRGTARWVHRLQHQAPQALRDSGVRTLPLAGTVFDMPVPPKGDLSALRYAEGVRREVGADEVEVEVRAVGLNFRDVMVALNLLPEDAVRGGYYCDTLGLECAGEVTRVGSGVTRLRVGDRVMAFGAGCFGSHVVTREILAVPTPERLSDAEAATIPTTYVTAHYALFSVGRLQKGERILVQAGAGGVGLAAIHLAKAAGAEVLATAGNPEKRAYLQSLGVTHVFDSRSLRFADDVRQATGGEGVDVVLNSLSGDFVAAGLGLLRQRGRFVEIGKKDVYENSKLGLAAFRGNVTYATVDIDRMLLEVPEFIHELLEAIVTRVRAGELPALPHSDFTAGEVEAAFRYMVGAKHRGKVVVRHGAEDTIRVAAAADKAPLFRGDASYLVTGGLGGFGLRTAQWMVEQGAGTVILAGRRGKVAADEAGAVEAMRAAGARVVIEKVDVSVEDEVLALLGRLKGEQAPLRGIYHAAMVLDDGLLTEMSEEQFLNAMRPKVEGAWLLHKYTAHMPLDQFVLYSSMSYVIGTPGQGNYSAANAYLEALARQRVASGRPALVINWGVLGEVGYVARNKIETLTKLHWKAIAPDEAMDIIGFCLRHRVPTASVFGVDWAKFARIMPMFGQSPRYAHLVVAGDDRSGSASGGSLRQRMEQVPPGERVAVMQAEITKQIANVFDMAPEGLDADRPLTDLGMDSLLAGQIRNWVGSELAIDFPTMGLMRGPSIRQLSIDLVARLRGDAVESAAADGEAADAPAGGARSAFVTPWLLCARPNSEGAPLRVFTFPFVGGGASVFSPWSQYLPRAIEVVAVQYPGRENRMHEPPFEDLPSLVEAAAEELLPYVDRAFVIYGHSMGGLVAYEVARRLQDEYGEVCMKLVIGGWPSPTLLEDYVQKLDVPSAALDTASDDELIDWLRRKWIFSGAEVEDPSMLKAVLPSVRSDLRMLMRYRFAPSGVVQCPITVLNGREDPLFTDEQLKGWGRLTTGEFRRRVVSGGHLFIRGDARQPLAVIQEELDLRVLPRPVVLAASAEQQFA